MNLIIGWIALIVLMINLTGHFFFDLEEASDDKIEWVKIDCLLLICAAICFK